MFNLIDNLLNKITMYRLVLYALLVIWAAALLFSALGFLGFSVLALLYSTLVILATSLAVNWFCAWFLGVQANTDSVYITTFILILLITPAQTGGGTLFLVAAAALAQASKYVVNIRGKHIFNPAAFAVAVTALTLNQSASWWVGNLYLMPLSAIALILIVQKLRKWDLALTFLAVCLGITFVASLGSSNIGLVMKELVIYSPLLFFAGVMLMEPLTMPPTRDGRIAYGILVALLFTPQTHIHFGGFYFSPELALLAGNIFSFIISPKGRHVLTLKQKAKVGDGVYDFAFTTVRPLKYKPGQYMEWTLGHKPSDSRGNRRYFTLASSPTEGGALLGVRFYEHPSSFKRALASLEPGDKIAAGSLAGDFTLPERKNQKLVFLAGGIGITPFRSMIKYLLDKNERRDIALFYSNRTAEEVVFHDVFDEAHEQLGIKTVYTLTEKNQLPPNWGGEVGYIDANMIARQVPDYKDRLFYISGSHTMVAAFKDILRGMGIHRSRIKTDFFPGLV
jgi:ferredoxin-NADP reductase